MQFPSGGSGGASEPWHIGYYITFSSNVFSVFNGENPNGDWIITIIETSVSSGVRFNSSSLIFSTPIATTGHTSLNANNDCVSPFCLRSNEVIIRNK